MSRPEVPARAEESGRGPPTRYPPLFGLAWLHFANDGAANFLPGVLPAVLVAIGSSASFAGVLMFVLVAGQALQPVAAMLGRPLGRRRLMWAGVALALIGAGAVGVATSLATLVIVLAAIGIANACFHPQALAAARVFAGGREHFGVAVMLLGGEVGRGLWPLIASVVVAWLGLQGLWLPAILALVTVPFVARLLPPPVIRSSEWRVRMRGRWAATARLLGYVTLRGCAVTGAVVYLPILWKTRGGGLIGGAALVTLPLIIGLVGTMYGGYLADRWGRRPVLLAAGFAMAGCLALVGWGIAPALWLGAALFGIPAFATFPLTTVSGQDLFPENRPFGSGVALGLGNALGTALIALLGLSIATLGLHVLFWILAAVALATAPMALCSETRRAV